MHSDCVLSAQGAAVNRTGSSLPRSCWVQAPTPCSGLNHELENLLVLLLALLCRSRGGRKELPAARVERETEHLVEPRPIPARAVQSSNGRGSPIAVSCQTVVTSFLSCQLRLWYCRAAEYVHCHASCCCWHLAGFEHLTPTLNALPGSPARRAQRHEQSAPYSRLTTNESHGNLRIPT